MYFFEDIYATCEECSGRRFKPEILAVKYRGKTIHDVLNLTVSDAQAFFSGSPPNSRRSSICCIRSDWAISGSDKPPIRFRRRSATAENRRRTQGSSAHNLLYILDEPTTGLHLDDIKKLLAVLHKLVDAGNTLVVVEHNLDVIKTADWVIDLGA